MDRYPNQKCMFDFCTNTLPLLHRAHPEVKLLIVGADPSPAVRRLGEQPGVTVTGSGPDVRPYVHRSGAMVAPPNIARGTQNKILEAMAMGVPVVTSVGAAGGVDATLEERFLVADTCEQQAAAVLRILEDRNERGRLAAAGCSRMLSDHAWANSLLRLRTIIERCLTQYARPH